MGTENELGEALKPWDRQPGESAKAFRAFSIYLSLGPSRSMNRAYQRHLAERAAVGDPGAAPGQEAGPIAKKSSTGRWNLWAQMYSWRERAEAYDTALEVERRRMREDEHFAQLRAHLDRQRQVAIALNGTALRMLQMVQAELAAQPDAGTPPGRHTLTPGRLPSYAKTAGTLARIALEAEGNALGIEEILGKLDEQAT